ncbi:coenzyme F420-0:L-glutamate ligase [Candidatus Hecatella orcuttiae]|jgi:F420-0:gamma-glutamyl ligase-like protein|uniref:coenzyme F420-0:L-glutamate ligase n=1 Tax=Candidatus Hecatella orcuttiae TaxID=1935119 RepID=UPI0028682367|nr:coenzyme F420-0:L-glutamate ligase [Candidatus Hecatella orcuttiae]
MSPPKIPGLKVKRIRTAYWLPGTNYLEEILRTAGKLVRNGDILAVSEKALSIAQGNIVDESKVEPGFASQFLVRVWMRLCWGYLLGFLCRLKPLTMLRLRDYPQVEGARHKQLVLEKTGLLQALRFSSEGGVDATNLPYSYVSLPLPRPGDVAEKIYAAFQQRLKKSVIVLIVDSDKTYSFRRLHLSPSPTGVSGIRSGGGFLYYLFGRMFKLKPRSTPKAVYPPEALTVEEALNLAEASHHILGYGAGKTMWDVAEKFNVAMTEVTWKMLKETEHCPIAILRRTSSADWRRGN